MPRLSLTRLYTTIITPATPTIQTAPVFTPLPPPRPTKPATLRSITLGFLLGLTVAGASGFGYLVEEYQTQNKNTTRHVAKMAESVETVHTLRDPGGRWQDEGRRKYDDQDENGTLTASR